MYGWLHLKILSLIHISEEALIAYNEGKVDIHAPVKVIVKDLDENGNIVDVMRETCLLYTSGKAYSLKEAASLVKEITYTKFDASLDIDVRLGVDPRKANQMVRGVVSLPHGTGKVVRVLVLCTPDAEAAAKEAGAAGTV